MDGLKDSTLQVGILESWQYGNSAWYTNTYTLKMLKLSNKEAEETAEGTLNSFTE